MHERREALAVGRVYDALRLAFPSVAPEIVEAAVRVAHGRLTGPVRDFVPVLVDKEARRLLLDLDERATNAAGSSLGPVPPASADLGGTGNVRPGSEPMVTDPSSATSLPMIGDPPFDRVSTSRQPP